MSEARQPAAPATAAEILAFPARPEDRLRRALRGLEAAMADQAAAVAGLRSELTQLSGALTGLEDSLVAYSGALDQAGQEAQRAHAEAKQLETIADGWLAKLR